MKTPRKRALSADMDWKPGKSSSFKTVSDDYTLKNRKSQPTKPNTSEMKSQVGGLDMFTGDIARQGLLASFVTWQTCMSEAKQIDGRDKKITTRAWHLSITRSGQPGNPNEPRHPALAPNFFQFQTISRKRTSILVTGTSVQIPEKI